MLNMIKDLLQIPGSAYEGYSLPSRIWLAFRIKGDIKYKKTGHLHALKQKNVDALDYWVRYTIIQLAAY